MMFKNNNEKGFLLAIETSVQGGGLSILQNGKELDFWQGSGRVSKSEHILEAVSQLLERNNIAKTDIESIVVSRGPGSFTGTRIGIAVALGLKKSLMCEIYGYSVMEAMALNSGLYSTQVTTAFLIGTDQLCIQKFAAGAKFDLSILTLPRIIKTDTFLENLKADSQTNIVIHRDLYNIFDGLYQFNEVTKKRIYQFEKNLAYLIGFYGKGKGASDNVKALYIETN